MTATFNKLLLSPGEDALVAALDAASRRAGEGRGRDDWRPALAEVAENAEGRMQIDSLTMGGSGRRYVTVAWWTDHQGRKHVRVVGGTRDHGGKDLHHSLMDRDQRPPLWHVCPERVFRAKRGGAEPVWLVWCGCGEIGIAQELGWAGDRCGPCHDRREEGEAVEEGVRPWIEAAEQIDALAFGPTGERLAISAGNRTSVFNLRQGGEVVITIGSDEGSYRPLAFSPDGRLLAGGASGGGRIILWDVVSDREEVGLAAAGSVVNSLAFSPDGKCLAAVGDDGELLRWGFRPDRPPIFHGGEQGVCSFAFHPKKATLAIGMPSSVVTVIGYDVRASEQCFRIGTGPEEDVQFVEYLPDAERLIALTGDPETAFERPWHLRRWSFERYRETHQSSITPPSAVAMSHDGRYLAMLCHDQRASPAAVTFWDLDRWRPAGWLEWNPDDNLRCLAFSPDGRWLATGSANGFVKLWPWRSLLEG